MDRHHGYRRLMPLLQVFRPNQVLPRFCRHRSIFYMSRAGLSLGTSPAAISARRHGEDGRCYSTLAPQHRSPLRLLYRRGFGLDEVFVAQGATMWVTVLLQSRKILV